MEYGDHLLRNSKILVIEDDRVQRLVLRKIFEDLGFVHVEEAENGKDGWEKTLRLAPDLVILDMKMPVMDGFEYCRVAREHPDFKDMTILVQTGLTDLGNKEEIFKVGATDYVTKPLDFHEVYARSCVHLKNAQNVKELKEYNTRVKNELFAARNLIEISLPDDRVIHGIKEKHKIDIAAKFESSQEMGGDFWGACPISDNRLAIYSIDVSGHGIDSALSALRIHTLLHVNIDEFHDPGCTLDWLNRQLTKLFPLGQFATMFYGVIDTENKTLSYSVSSTTSPILLKNNKFPPKVISGRGYPLGVLQEATFQTECIPFEPGDTIILYSDAITEATQDGQNILGEDGFIELLHETFQQQKEFSCDKVLQGTLESFYQKYGKKLDDDLTVVYCHYLP